MDVPTARSQLTLLCGALTCVRFDLVDDAGLAAATASLARLHPLQPALKELPKKSQAQHMLCDALAAVLEPLAANGAHTSLSSHPILAAHVSARSGASAFSLSRMLQHLQPLGCGAGLPMAHAARLDAARLQAWYAAVRALLLDITAWIDGAFKKGKHAAAGYPLAARLLAILLQRRDTPTRELDAFSDRLHRLLKDKLFSDSVRRCRCCRFSVASPPDHLCRPCCLLPTDTKREL